VGEVPPPRGAWVQSRASLQNKPHSVAEFARSKRNSRVGHDLLPKDYCESLRARRRPARAKTVLPRFDSLDLTETSRIPINYCAITWPRHRFARLACLREQCAGWAIYRNQPEPDGVFCGSTCTAHHEAPPSRSGRTCIVPDGYSLPSKGLTNPFVSASLRTRIVTILGDRPEPGRAPLRYLDA